MWVLKKRNLRIKEWNNISTIKRVPSASFWQEASQQISQTLMTMMTIIMMRIQMIQMMLIMMMMSIQMMMIMMIR